MAITDGLIHHWTLDEASGTRSDSIGSADATVISGEPSVSLVKLGNGIELNESDGSLDTNTQILTAANTAMTMNVWCTVHDSLSQGFLVGGSGATFIAKTAAGNGNMIAFWFGASGTRSIGIPVSLNTLTMMTLTYNTTDGLKLFVNAAQVGTTQAAAGVLNAPADWGIGGDAAGTNIYDGKLDEISVWNRSISLAEIEEVYNNGVGIALASPVLTEIKTREVRDTILQNYPGMFVKVAGADQFELMDRRTEEESGSPKPSSIDIQGRGILSYRQVRPYLDASATVLAETP